MARTQQTSRPSLVAPQSSTTAAPLGKRRRPSTAKLAKPLTTAGARSSLTLATGERPGERQGEARAAALAELGKSFRHVFRTLSRLRGRDTHLAGSQVSHAQFELLIELFERGELPAGELAAAAQLTPATVTQMLDHLASSGHVERSRSQRDRRVVVSKLTSKGRRQVQAKRDAWQARWEAALQEVDASELRAATRVLERLCDVFSDGSQEPGCAR